MQSKYDPFDPKISVSPHGDMPRAGLPLVPALRARVCLGGRLALRYFAARDINHKLRELGGIARAFQGFVGHLLLSCQSLEC
jgi:hypothetical protein